MRGRSWLLAAPLVAYLGIFLTYPTAYAVVLAFSDTVGGGFPSLENFRLLSGDRLFWRALAGNLVLPVLTLALELAAGLALALLLPSPHARRRLEPAPGAMS
jgi:ABC-type sugar transport system permease subunit